MTQDKQELQEIYRYGYKLLALQASNIAVAVAIGLAFSCLKEMALFLIVYIPLRSYAGGYHADGPVKCSIISAALELTVAVILQFQPPPALLTATLLPVTALCGFIIYTTAPVAAKNKPLTDSQERSFKKKTRSILVAEMAIMVIFCLTGVRRIWPVIAMSHIFVAALLLAGKSPINETMK